MRRLPIIALVGLTTCATISIAQMRAPAMTLPGAVAPSGFGRGVSVSFNGGFRHRPFGPGAIFLGDPFYTDYAEPSPLPPPQVVIVQPANASEVPSEANAEPLLIELQGDRYVRFGGRQNSAQRSEHTPLDFAKDAHAPMPNDQHTQPEPPPAILIFRDGHREPVSEYAIVGSTLYTTGDYFQSGRWTRNIQLATLNLPATIQANHDAGVKFILPTAPNQVVTRP